MRTTKMRTTAILFLCMLAIAEGSMMDKVKIVTNTLHSIKEKIPPSVRDKVSVIFGGLATAYNIKWMWDCTFADPNTHRDEKIKGILINKLEDDETLSPAEFRRFKARIIAGGNEMNIVYSHCVESRWFGQTACIQRDLEEMNME